MLHTRPDQSEDAFLQRNSVHVTECHGCSHAHSLTCADIRTGCWRSCFVVVVFRNDAPAPAGPVGGSVPRPVGSPQCLQQPRSSAHSGSGPRGKVSWLSRFDSVFPLILKTARVVFITFSTKCFPLLCTEQTNRQQRWQKHRISFIHLQTFGIGWILNN